MITAKLGSASLLLFAAEDHNNGCGEDREPLGGSCGRSEQLVSRPLPAEPAGGRAGAAAAKVTTILLDELVNRLGSCVLFANQCLLNRFAGVPEPLVAEEVTSFLVSITERSCFKRDPFMLEIVICVYIVVPEGGSVCVDPDGYAHYVHEVQDRSMPRQLQSLAGFQAALGYGQHAADL